MSNLDELRQEFTKITGKQAFSGWNEEQLEKIIAKKKDEAPKIQESTEEIKNPPKVVTNEEEELVNIVENDEFKTEIVQGEEFEKLSEDDRVKEAKRINSMQYKTIPEDLTPVFRDGEPYCIIDDKYIPFKEAQILVQERRVKNEQEKLEQLKKSL